MSDPTSILPVGIDPSQAVAGAKVIEQVAGKVVADVGKMSKAFDDFGDGIAKKSRPGLEALKQAMVGSVSEMVKQLEYLGTAYDRLQRGQAKSIGEIERLEAKLVAVHKNTSDTIQRVTEAQHRQTQVATKVTTTPL